MADGAVSIELDDSLAARLKRAAKAAGMSEDAYARQVLEQRLFNYRDYSWPAGFDPDPAVDEAIAEQSLRDGDALEWSEVEDRLRTRLRDALNHSA